MITVPPSGRLASARPPAAKGFLFWMRARCTWTAYGILVGRRRRRRGRRNSFLNNFLFGEPKWRTKTATAASISSKFGSGTVDAGGSAAADCGQSVKVPFN